MARRYRYTFAKRKEAERGIWSVGLAVGSILLFLLAVLWSDLTKQKYGFVTGGISIFAGMLSAYGFYLGLSGFSEKDRKHRTCVVGSIANGIILVFWVGLYMLGLG